MTKINMSGSQVGAKALCAVTDPVTLEVLPLLATSNGDGTSTLKIDSELTATIDPTGLATSTKQDTLKTAVDTVATKQDTGNASLSTIESELSLRDIGSSIRLVNNGASQSIVVPATAKAFSCNAEGGDVRLEIDGVADATSTIRIPEDTWLSYPIDGGTQTLFSYGNVAVISNVRFLG